jgi:TRAP-type C4-dicarboxylate transport system substrate-binding protein
MGMALVLAVVMLFAFAACGENGGNSGSSSDTGIVTDDGSSGSNTVGGGSADTKGEVDKSDWIKLDLSVATYLPPSEAATLMETYFREGLQNHMGAEWVDITWYPSGTLLTQESILDGLKVGTADIAFVDLASFPEDFPVCNLWGQPGVPVYSSVGGIGAFSEWCQTNQDNFDEFNDIVFLSGQNNGVCTFLMAKEVKTPADLVGKTIRCAPVFADTLKELGINPITMPIGEVYEGLRSGLIDGAYASIGGQVGWDFSAVAPYALIVPMNNQSYMWGMNRDLFESMPLSEQKAFMDGWNEAFWDHMLPGWEEMQILSTPAVQDGTEKLKTLVAYEPGSADANAFVDPVIKLRDDYMKKLDDMGYDSAAILKDIEAECDKWVENWWTFDRENEPYFVWWQKTYDEWLANYAIPEPMPEHAAYIFNLKDRK